MRLSIRLVPAAVSLIALLLGVAACGDEEEDTPQVATATESASPTAAVPLTPSPDTTTTPASETAIPTPSPDWATITNTAYGFSFDYPSNWLLNPGNPFKPDPATSTYIAISNHEPPVTGGGEPPPADTVRDKLRIEFVVLENPEHLNLEDWVGSYHAMALTPRTVLSNNVATVNGASLVRQVISYGGDHRGSLVAFADLGGVVLLINGPQADSLFLDTYERILASLKAAP